MILRNVAIRHGRKALATPLRTSFLRGISTEAQDPMETDLLAQFMQVQEQSMKTNPVESQSTKSGIPPEDIHRQRQYIQSQSPKPQKIDDVAEDWETWNTIRKRTHKLGSVIAPHYEPSDPLKNPPRPQDVTLELLMASQSHMGHNTSVWNPMNQRYIYGVRQGIHIISLETTAAHLRRAAKVVEGVSYHGGLILFVGNRKGQMDIVVKAAEMAKGCHLFDKWVPGTLTNGNQILRNCGIRAIDENDNDVDGYDDKLGDWRALKPDLVVVMNPMENYLMLHECGVNNIPTIGVIDTDADPTWVTYPIPANDDSLRCIQLIAGVLGRAAEAGRELRLEAAATGKITWSPPPGLGRPWTESDKKQALEDAKAAAKKEHEKTLAERSRSGGGQWFN